MILLLVAFASAYGANVWSLAGAEMSLEDTIPDNNSDCEFFIWGDAPAEARMDSMQPACESGNLPETIPDDLFEDMSYMIDDRLDSDMDVDALLGDASAPVHMEESEPQLQEALPPASKRGRKTGSVASRIARQAVADAKAAKASLSLGDKRRLASRARWDKVKQEKTQAVVAMQAPASSVNPEDLAMMPFSKCNENLSLVSEVMALKAPQEDDPPKLERKIWSAIHQSASFQNVASKLCIARGTLQNRLRVMALMVVVFKRFRAAHVITLIDAWLHSKHAGHVRRLEWLCKFKYDEMSLVMTLPRPGAVSGGEKHLTKLLQLTVSWSALWLVGNTPVTVSIKVPTQLKPIARNTAKCNFHGLVPQLQCPDVADDFEKKSLMAIADDHPANGLAESTIWSLAGGGEGGIALERFRCTAHKADKVGKFGSAPMTNDMRGVLHGCLSFQFAGVQSAFRKAMKAYIRRPGVFKYKPWGEGPSQRAQDYNKLVFSLFYNDVASKKLGKQSKERIAWYHGVKSMFNGRLRIHSVVEHWCRGCCRNAADCLRRIDAIIDKMYFPAVWKSSTWNECLQALDFLGLWSSIHGLLEPVFNLCMFPDGKKVNSQMTPSGVGGNQPGSDALHHDESRDDATDGEELVGSEEGLQIIDPDKQDSQMQRQSTYRTNGSNWLASRPLGRLMAMRRISGVQQENMASWFKQSGKTFELQEMNRRLNGDRPNHRMLLYLQGQYTERALCSFGSLMEGQPGEWPLPVEFQTHVLALKIFQSTAASAASMLVLLAAQLGCFPYRGYKLLIAQSAEQKWAMASQIIEDFAAKPCVFDGFWYEHTKAFCSTESMLSQESLSILWHHCLHAELDNIDTETRNASIRRDAHRSSTQRKVLDVQDLDSMWVMRQEREDNDLIRDFSPDPSSSEGEEAKLDKGRGGRQRAFWSGAGRMPEFKKENRQPDFKKISEFWHAEKGKDFSEMLERCVDEGRKATRVGQAQRAHTAMRDKHDHDDQSEKPVTMSSFGTVRPRDKALLSARTRDKALLQTLSLADHGDAQAPDRVLDGGQQIIPAQALGTLANTAGNTIQEQCTAIKRVLRLVGKEDAQRMRECQQLVKVGAKQDIKIGDDVLNDMDLPDDVTLRSVPSGCDIVSIRPVLNSKMFAASRSHVACSLKRRNEEQLQAKLKQKLEDTWKFHHGFEDEEDLEDLPEVHPSFKPTMCFTMGFGRCLCTGPGKVLGLARSQFAKSICKLFPKKSVHRHWLTQGWLLVEVGNKYYHVSLCYLKPQRPTYTRMHVPDTTFWQRRHAIPLFIGEKPDTILDLDLIEELDLDGPMTLRLHKFVVFDKSYTDWTPIARLTFEKLSEHMEGVPENVHWWNGTAAELAVERDKQTKKREAEARARARAKAVPAPKANGRVKAKAKPPSCTQRDSQQPAQECAGVDAQMLALPAPVFPIFVQHEQDFPDDVDYLFAQTPSDLSDVDVLHAQQEDDEAKKHMDVPSDWEDDGVKDDVVSINDDLFGDPVFPGVPEQPTVDATIDDDLFGDPVFPGEPQQPSEDVSELHVDADNSCSIPSPPSLPSVSSSSSSDSETETSSSADVPGDPACPKVEGPKPPMPRGAHMLSWDDKAPSGCRLRAYLRKGDKISWQGTLPPGVHGEGEHTGHTLSEIVTASRPLDTVGEHILQWLWGNYNN